MRFQSTPPVKAATRKTVTDVVAFVFQSTPPVKAATLLRRREQGCKIISIHAAREGGDDTVGRAIIKILFISIHAAREGGDGYSIGSVTNWLISIHAAREGGDVKCPQFGFDYLISIHAAREGGDL